MESLQYKTTIIITIVILLAEPVINLTVREYSMITLQHTRRRRISIKVNGFHFSLQIAIDITGKLSWQKCRSVVVVNLNFTL